MESLSDLRQGVRDWISEPYDGGVYTNPMLTRQINRSLRRLALKILNIYPEFYYDTATITSVAGQYLYQVDSDYHSTLGIKNSDGVYLAVAEIEDLQFADQTSNREADATRYGRKGNYIWLGPTPSTDGKTYTHEFYIVPATLSGDTDEPNFPQGYEHLIEVDAALRCGIISGAQINAIKMGWMEEWNEMLQTLPRWQTFDPPRIGVSHGNFGAVYPNTTTVK